MKLENGGSRISNPGVILNNGDGAGWIRPSRGNRIEVGDILPARKRPADDPRATPLVMLDSTESVAVDSFARPDLVRFWRDEGTSCDGSCGRVRPLTGLPDGHKHYAREWAREDPDVTVLAEWETLDGKDGGKPLFVGMLVCWTSDLPLVSPQLVTRAQTVSRIEQAAKPAVRFLFPAAPVPPVGNMREDADVLWREWRDREDARTLRARIARATARTNREARKLANSRLFIPAGVHYVKRSP